MYTKLSQGSNWKKACVRSLPYLLSVLQINASAPDELASKYYY
jgi:hypothetical protein